MPDDQQIIVEQVGDVAVFTLNRPERLNAWTTTMMRQLRAALRGRQRRPERRRRRGHRRGPWVLRRRRHRGRVRSGRRRRRPRRGRPTEAERPTPASDWVRLCRSSKPLLAAINGPAIGIGLTMVLPFDQLIAAEGAKLSARFVKMGLVPELASSHFLVARCGFGNASWLALSGTTMLAEDAVHAGPRRSGRASRAAPGGHHGSRPRSWPRNPPTQVRLIKELLTRNADETDLAEVQRRELAALEIAYTTPEHHEAVRAFLEKRPPVFR